MRFLPPVVFLSILNLLQLRGLAQEPEKAPSLNPSSSKEEPPGDPDNKRIRVSRFIVAPGQDITLPVIVNESLVTCLHGDSVSRVPIRGVEEKLACGSGNAAADHGGATYMVSNSGTIPAEILVLELKDAYAIGQLRVPWSERDPVSLDPSHFHVAFENEHARILRLHLDPREGTIESQFADRLYLGISKVHESITDADGKNHDVQHEAGTAHWQKAVMFSIVNLAEQPLDELIVELKHPFCYELPENVEEVPGATPSMKAYAAKVRETVYKKWMKHMPSAVRNQEDRGFVLLQFKIDADGTVPEDSLRFRTVFSDESLMEKALASVRDASPFPPLPPDAPKQFMGMRFQFMYNLPRQPPGCR